MPWKKPGLLGCLAVMVACTEAAAPSPAMTPPDVAASADASDPLDAPADALVASDATVTPDAPVTSDLPVTPDAPPPGLDAAPAPPDTPRPDPARPTVRQMLRRVVHARAVQNLRWTIDRETPESVGRALASLRPTYVSGLLRVAGDDTLSPEHVRDFNTIRRIVRDASPDCQFDVVLNGQHYDTPAALRRKMESLTEAVHPDAWFFDFFYSAYLDGYRNPLDEGVAWAHEHRQYIGGNTTGDDSVPRSDFAALSPVSHAGMVADGELDLKREEIQRLHGRGFPVLMHINNDPQFAPTTESCYFMGASGRARLDWSHDRRVRWITERAGDQEAWHFRFMYPVFFPECPIWHTYNAPRDGNMMDVFADLVRRFN